MTLPTRSTVWSRALVAAVGTALVAGTLTSVAAQQVPTDRARLEAVLHQLADGLLPLDELRSIPIAEESQELQRVIEDLRGTRAELRALRDRYVDEYPPIQERLSTIATIESVAIPRIVRGLIADLPGSDGL